VGNEWYDGENGWAITVGLRRRRRRTVRDDLEAAALYGPAAEVGGGRSSTSGDEQGGAAPVDRDGAPHVADARPESVLASRMVRDYTEGLLPAGGRSRCAGTGRRRRATARPHSIRPASWRATVGRAFRGNGPHNPDHRRPTSTRACRDTPVLWIEAHPDPRPCNWPGLRPDEVTVQAVVGRVDTWRRHWSIRSPSTCPTTGTAAGGDPTCSPRPAPPAGCRLSRLTHRSGCCRIQSRCWLRRPNSAWVTLA